MNDKINELLAEPLAQKVFFFKEMLTPSLIRLAYWLCLVGVAWNGLGHMFSGGFFHFIEGIAFIATGAILARVVAELVILLFKLNENMEMVANNTKAGSLRITKTSKKATKKVSKKA
ncbi:MAG: hypothetical protein ACI9WC_000555 [Arenicella sp.]|jgi:hypothetical protein